jgi:hypothetical protein
MLLPGHHRQWLAAYRRYRLVGPTPKIQSAVTPVTSLLPLICITSMNAKLLSAVTTFDDDARTDQVVW